MGFKKGNKGGSKNSAATSPKTSKKSTATKSYIRKVELKFMTHDLAQKNGYTFKKIRDAALMMLQPLCHRVCI